METELLRVVTYQQAMVLALVTARGLTYRQVAIRLDLAPSHVRRLIRQGLQQIAAERSLWDRAAPPARDVASRPSDTAGAGA